MNNWIIAQAKVTDVAFIIDSWCADENVHTSRPAGEDEDIFKVGQRGRVLRLISSCQCLVVRPTEAWFTEHGKPYDPKLVHGWVCIGRDRQTLRPIIHFIYVKAEFRRNGLASALLAMAGVKPELGAWATANRPWLRKAREQRGIMYNRFLLDFDPNAVRP